MSDQSRIRILHVDDEPDLADVAAAALEKENERFAVETATDVETALDAIEARDPDCVVSDYAMPRQDGLEFLEAVRADYPELPFVVFTARGSEAVASEAFAAGATDYLQKRAGTDQYAVLAKRIEKVVEQRRERAAALETERRLSQLADQSNDVLWMFTADWDELLFVNAAYERVYGRSRDRLREEPGDFLAAIHPEDRERVRDAMASISAGEEVDIEYRVNEAEDYERWVWVQAGPITDEDGDVMRVAGFSRDVTERRERERELEQYETIVESIPEGVFVIDENGTIRTGNERAARMLGYEADELMGKSFERLVEDGVYPPEIFDTYLEHVRVMLSAETDRPQAQFDQPVTVDGEERIFEIHLALRPADDEFRGTIGIARDATEQRRQQETLREQNERLEEFASIVSHDLRNPLNLAQGHLELASEECDSDHLQTVRDAHDRMERLIEDLLTIAKHGKSSAERERVHLADLARGCWQTVDVAGATLETSVDATVVADEIRLREVLENLFRNAVEHAGPDVTVTLGGLPDGFYVADDGPGVPPEEREDIFEYGYSTAEEGTGLGLSIVSRVADAHGWTVNVTESETGGAKFEVTGVEFAED